VLVCLVPHESPERHNGGDAGEKHEEDGGQGLRVDRVLQITQVVRVVAFDVANQATKKSAMREHWNWAKLYIDFIVKM
jgi:hypothetical protein